MRGITFILILFLLTGISKAQNLVGYKNMEIRNFMKTNRKDMNLNTVKNSLFSYLKYTDNLDTQTILFFLTKDSVCSSVREIFTAGMKNQKIEELNSNYRKIDNNSWLDTRGNKKYIIKLNAEEWTCTITYESEK